MKKQVFIIADIGFGQNNSFHVGDEAMFISNIKRYKDFGWKISASSRSLPHPCNNFEECLDIPINKFLIFIKFIFFLIILNTSKINLFPKYFHRTIESLKKSQLLHISGGGNIASLWPGHIYYRSFMIIFACFNRIPIIMTSQTIGPITKKIHMIVIFVALNMVKFIGVRDNSQSMHQLKKNLIFKPKIQWMPDDATFLKYDKKMSFVTTNRKNIKIGLSFHKWINDGKKLKEIIKCLDKEFKNIHFYTIPHYFDKNNGIDIEFMKNITSLISKEKIHRMNSGDFFKKNSIFNATKIIKEMTSNMDIIISTRYHGLVFSLSSGVPCIAINYDNYYLIKNSGLLNMYFNNAKKYSINYEELDCNKISNLIKKVIIDKETISKDLKSKIQDFSFYQNDFYHNLIEKYSL